MSSRAHEHDVAILGCGLMGAAIARTLARSGLSVAAWNRTHSKAQELANEGVRALVDVQDAIAAAPLVIAVTNAYESLWDNLAATTGWEGATLVNLATGTPEEVEVLHQRMTKKGARYLDGMVVCYPEGIGEPDAFLSYAGSAEAWAEHGEVLKLLGGQTHYVAQDPKVSMLMTVWYSAFFVSSLTAYVEAIAFAVDNGITCDVIDTLTPLLIDLLGHAAPEISAAISSGHHETDQAAIDTYYEGSVPVLQVMNEAGHHARTYRAALASMAAARDAGLGGKGYSALAMTARSLAAASHPQTPRNC